jgi:hypothetical protein
MSLSSYVTKEAEHYVSVGPKISAQTTKQQPNTVTRPEGDRDLFPLRQSCKNPAEVTKRALGDPHGIHKRTRRIHLLYIVAVHIVFKHTPKLAQ